MNKPSFRNWQSVQTEVLRRIHAREWEPGDLIPNESDLALEFGCARTTVNRALRAIADSGLLDRRRKAGTRVLNRSVNGRVTASQQSSRQEQERQEQASIIIIGAPNMCGGVSTVRACSWLWFVDSPRAGANHGRDRHHPVYASWWWWVARNY